MDLTTASATVGPVLLLLLAQVPSAAPASLQRAGRVHLVDDAVAIAGDRRIVRFVQRGAAGV